MLQAQCIPWDQSPLDIASYDVFLAQRRELIADRLNQFLGLDGMADIAKPRAVDPYMRHLDERTEQIELALRSAVSTVLAGKAEALPQHVRDKLRDRVATAVRKDPSRRSGLTDLDDQLQYCDLRELQDVITAKTLWPQFEATFGSKEMLATRFGQLAELRNALRHTRELTPVTRKEGDAALDWFAGVLRRT